jgi:hypothetical protein
MSALGFVRNLLGIAPDKKETEEPDRETAESAEGRRRARRVADDEQVSLSYVPKRGEDWGTVKSQRPE